MRALVLGSLLATFSSLGASDVQFVAAPSMRARPTRH
jgi:hypothetical protein